MNVTSNDWPEAGWPCPEAGWPDRSAPGLQIFRKRFQTETWEHAADHSNQTAGMMHDCSHTHSHTNMSSHLWNKHNQTSKHNSCNTSTDGRALELVRLLQQPALVKLSSMQHVMSPLRVLAHQRGIVTEHLSRKRETERERAGEK